MRSDTKRGEWLSCPKCGSSRVDVETHNGYEASMTFDCRECGKHDGYWL